MHNNFALYVHIPWCLHKCSYCDFNAHVAKGLIQEQDYVARLLADLRADVAQFPFLAERKLSSIFIGGGTPNLLSSKAIASLMDGIRMIIPHDPNSIESTIEINPAVQIENAFIDYVACGITRVSIGVQTFNPLHLKFLERQYTQETALRAIEKAMHFFAKVNVDLMFGFYRQSVADALNDLQILIANLVAHISWYQLTIEPNSKFYSRKPLLANDDDLCDMTQAGLAYLHDMGLKRYEISAFARDQSAQARHNINYWRFGDYLGIGAGACGKLTDEQGLVWRTQKTRHPKDYLRARPVEDIATISQVAKEQLVFEYLLNNLRLQDGFMREHFEFHTRMSWPSLIKLLDNHIQKGHLIVDDNSMRSTSIGWCALDEMLQIFL